MAPPAQILYLFDSPPHFGDDHLGAEPGELGPQLLLLQTHFGVVLDSVVLGLHRGDGRMGEQRRPRAQESRGRKESGKAVRIPISSVTFIFLVHVYKTHKNEENREHNDLAKLVPLIEPSTPFPVFNPISSPGRGLRKRSSDKADKFVDFILYYRVSMMTDDSIPVGEAGRRREARETT